MIRAYAPGVAGAIAALLAAAMQIGPATEQARATTAENAPRICIVVPHFKDEYWLSVGFGMRMEAERQDAELLIFESGGYHSLERQIELLDGCLRQESDVILIGAVSADDPRLLAAVDRVAQEVPVLALVNALNADSLVGAIGVDWVEMGGAVGKFLAERHPAGTAPVRAVLISGPSVSGWSPLVESGLHAGLAGSAVEIVAVRRADTGLREQLREVEAALRDDPNVDYLIGSAPAIEGAMGLKKRRYADGPPDLIATYISHSVRRGLQSGQVLAVPYDDPAEQGRLGISMAVEASRGIRFEGTVGPEIRLIEAGQPAVAGISLSPAGFVPVLE